MTHATDGTYTVSFKSNLGAFGAGVVVLSDLKVSGGDSAFVFEGKFQEEGDLFVGNIRVRQHSRAMSSIFGPMSKFELALRGRMTVHGGQFSGHVIGHQALSLDVSLVKQHGAAA
jgi:hypothetical protein